MDVISLISKRMSFPDAKNDNYVECINSYYANGPLIHDYLHEMNRSVLQKYDVMTVGEGPGIDLTNGLQYVAEDLQELNMIFHFDHMFMDAGPDGKYDPIPVDLVKFKKVFSDWDKALAKGGWGSIFLGNHDFSRMVSRFGNDSTYRKRSAKLLCSLLLTLRGTVYIYQGDEIGMTNVAFNSIEDYNDIETLNAWEEARAKGKDMELFIKAVHMQSRDNARTPMQWDPNGGFTSGAPWIKMNPNYSEINVTDQENDPDSILNFYRGMIAFRKRHPVLVYGDYQCLDPMHPSIYSYRRCDDIEEFVVIHNFSESTIRWNKDLNDKDYDLIKTNDVNNSEMFLLTPWQTQILKRI
jgi:oligo-1,6-glucosidase